MQRKIKFGVFTDLHVDIMHDTQERLTAFIEDCRKEDVDFIIQLGDFCYPDENRKCVCKPENRPANIEYALKVKTYADKEAIIHLFNDFEKPSYHVLGNHECDMCSKQETLDYYKMNRGSYYSFDMGGFHFVVLDANYYKKDGQYIAYSNGNYFDESYHKVRVLPYLPPEEIEWLREDLNQTALPSILFSHQCLSEDNPRGILNAADVKQVLLQAPGGVLAAFNGHEHLDYEEYQDGIWFVNLNSMSCNWVDTAYTCYGIYGEEMDEKYPNIKYTVPYQGPLYAMITLDEEGAHIKGTQSDFAGPSPEERGIFDEGGKWMIKHKNKRLLTAQIRSRHLPFMK